MTLLADPKAGSDAIGLNQPGVTNAELSGMAIQELVIDLCTLIYRERMMLPKQIRISMKWFTNLLTDMEKLMRFSSAGGPIHHGRGRVALHVPGGQVMLLADHTIPTGTVRVCFGRTAT